MAADSHCTIKARAEFCSNSFCDALELLAIWESPTAWTQLRDQFGRFKIWSLNLGVFAGLHGSLDYRLRDLPEAREVIIDNLDVISNRLKDCKY